MDTGRHKTRVRTPGLVTLSALTEAISWRPI